MADSLFNHVDLVSYAVTDWQRAKQFYAETLGLPVAAFITDEVGWMEFGPQDGTHLAISQWREPGSPPTGGGAVVVFAVADAYQAVAELRRRGVRCDDGVKNLTTKRTKYTKFLFVYFVLFVVNSLPSYASVKYCASTPCQVSSVGTRR